MYNTIQGTVTLYNEIQGTFLCVQYNALFNV